MNQGHIHLSAECSCGHKFKIDDLLSTGGISFFACPGCGTAGSVSDKQVARLARVDAVSVPALSVQ